MLNRVRQSHPEARHDGFSVQAMARRPEASELILGLKEDTQFGPVLLVGQGGSGAEVLRDRALGLPPLNLRLARAMLEETRVHARLRGGAGLPSADLDAIALALVRLAELAVEVPEIVELDVNPLLADAEGILALDARVRLRFVTVSGSASIASASGTDSPTDAQSGMAPPAASSGTAFPAESRGRTERAGDLLPGGARLAIRPYPRDLEEELPLPDGRQLWIRPIQPEDEPALQAHFGRLDPEESRMRFFVPRRTLDHLTAARFCQLDYDREMALVLTEPGPAGTRPIHGVVSLNADPGLVSAEFAIVINRDMTGMGLGILLMRRMLDDARRRGLREVHGEVLRENRPMLTLCKLLGFTQGPIPDEPGLVEVRLALLK
jgi:acetyltransferase